MNAKQIWLTVGPSFSESVAKLEDAEVISATLSNVNGWLKDAAGSLRRATVLAFAEIVWHQIIGPAVARVLRRHKMRFFDRFCDRIGQAAAHWAFLQIVSFVFTLYQRSKK